MLNLKSDDDVLMIGLWGQGGIGKTTLAKALYNAIFRQFEGSCFLANVQEASRDSKDLVSVQKKLLSDILVGKGLAMTSVDEGINLMQHRLCRKKILLVLDYVNDLEQLNALAGDCEWFGKGSRIIITTRDSHLLTSHGIDEDHIYEVQTLENCEALELFNKHAFVRNNKIEIRRDLVDSALRYANGLPLALEVLGSFLRGRREHEWESALSKLAKSPNEKINKVLKLSYDGLEQNEKEIFLDIACFFKGRNKKDIMKVLDGCGFDTSIGVQVLVEKSLIFEDGWTLCMHDLIRMMGMDIVKQECLDDPGKRSRLWLYDDVHYVLSRDMGANAVKAIVLDLHEPKEICIGPDAFTNMKRLRLLIMINVHASLQGPIGLPNELRWFEWPECPWVPQFSSGPKKLVGLDLQRSNIQVVREQFKDFEKLKFINLMECQSLVSMPDLSCMPNLEDLDLQGCKNLESAHDSVAYLRKLRSLDLGNCSKLQRFPDIPDKNESLQEVYLEGISIMELPTSIENLVSLERMYLFDCKKLAILPSSIYRLQKLEILQLEGCSKLIKFPKEEEDLGEPHTKTGFPMLSWLNLGSCNLSEVEFLENLSCFPSLQKLDLWENNFTNLPTCEKLYNLESLDVSYCQQLQEIPKIPGKLRRLHATSCESLSRIPSNICDVEIVELYSHQEPVRNGFSVNDLFKLEKFHRQKNCRVILPGGEMPKWLLPNKEGYISFVASKDLYKKILGVAFCVVFRVEGSSLFPFELIGSVNCKCTKHNRHVRQFDLDHVWLEYMESKEVWTVDDFGPNDLSHFHVSIRVSESDYGPRNRVFVKKCGFRLICKPLKNDLEVLLQDDQLLDPALLYEVSHEDNPTSTEEESSSETEDLQDSKTCTEEEGLNMVDFSIEKHRYSSIDSDCRNVRPGGEMPKEFVIVEDGTISFMASQDLYNKFQGLYLCVVFGVEDGKKEVSFDIVPRVNGQRRNGLSGTLGSFDTDHVWFQLLRPNALWGMLEGSVDFGQFDESYLRFSLDIRVAGGTVKKLGYVIQSLPLGDALKVELEKNRLMDAASLCEDDESPWYRIRQKGYPSKNVSQA
ncbi:TMV resistance protein N-like [Syzygium oleosum]|uniref:TMV resistance protein N-like n=1 Tax=Syzygium oleosum TaxID=219896 RepID=UPI0024BA166A|nr:TMV resistance protein N-like [Syzygium oleosum]